MLESLAKFYLAMKGFGMVMAGIVILFWVVLFAIVMFASKKEKSS